ncbi:MAG: hypothetical protein NC131_06275 [Roseburia sp.]|nr:hypothetical protein [Roseburia sp.]
MEQEDVLKVRTHQFIAPSGYSYTIREENGEDEEILSNQADAQNGNMNLTKFIAAIVVKTDFTESGKLSIQDSLNLPFLDRYTILIQNRIFSLGHMLEFSYQWPGEDTPVVYEQDLRELLYDDYSAPISEEEKAAKPFAIPQYPDQELAKELHYRNLELTLSSGKQIKLDWADGNAEYQISKLPANKQTRNSSLIARNLQLKVGENWEKVQRFHLFSVRDMAEIQKAANKMDPTTSLMVEIENPVTGATQMYPVVIAPRFFFLTEA